MLGERVQQAQHQFRYTGVTIDPGFTNIQKLPRTLTLCIVTLELMMSLGYAQFGNMNASSDPEEDTTTQGMGGYLWGTRLQGILTPHLGTTSTARPRASTGVQQLFEEEFPDDALATAPPSSSVEQSSGANTADVASDAVDGLPSSNFKPTRSVCRHALCMASQRRLRLNLFFGFSGVFARFQGVRIALGIYFPTGQKGSSRRAGKYGLFWYASRVEPSPRSGCDSVPEEQTISKA